MTKFQIAEEIKSVLTCGRRPIAAYYCKQTRREKKAARPKRCSADKRARLDRITTSYDCRRSPGLRSHGRIMTRLDVSTNTRVRLYSGYFVYVGCGAVLRSTRRNDRSNLHGTPLGATSPKALLYLESEGATSADLLVRSSLD